MQSIELIRQENLRKLIASAGGQRKLSDKINKSEAQISQWLTGTLLPSGKMRSISSESARAIEAALNLAQNWMDNISEVHRAESRENWPFIDIDEAEWDAAPDRIKGLIEGYAQRLIEETKREFTKTSESQKETLTQRERQTASV